MGAFDDLAAEAATCMKCALGRTRTNVVFGVGSTRADVMFVGEAPGYHEDQQGEPFVGKSGALLTQLLGEIGLRREDAYIANILKCRPPENRDPLPIEIEACTPYLDSQIELIDPIVIVTLGNFATKYLLETTAGITRLRGNRYRFRDAVLVPTYHPAAALRGGAGKLDEMRLDFSLVRRTIDTGRKPVDAGAAEETTPEHVEQLGFF
jgi:uracil-DNA glycosylase family 4